MLFYVKYHMITFISIQHALLPSLTYLVLTGPDFLPCPDSATSGLPELAGPTSPG